MAAKDRLVVDAARRPGCAGWRRRQVLAGLAASGAALVPAGRRMAALAADAAGVPPVAPFTFDQVRAVA
ncbi:MAG: hypothetical protein IRY94_10620, partial [Rhodospirillaceae bacterium]|nr:hypothetical protein [Rhodospirillaceae bacterium]